VACGEKEKGRMKKGISWALGQGYVHAPSLISVPIGEQTKNAFSQVRGVHLWPTTGMHSMPSKTDTTPQMVLTTKHDRRSPSASLS
jgi:hypothetical protein